MPFFYKDTHDGALPLATATALTGEAAARWTAITEAEYHALCQNCPAEHSFLPPPITVEQQAAPVPLPDAQPGAPPTTVQAVIEHK